MKRSVVNSLLRTTQAYSIQICEKETLEYGIAYSSEQFPDVADVQQFREVIATEPDTLAKALTEADSYFEECGRRCLVFAPAKGNAEDATNDFFKKHGFERRCFVALALTEWVDISPRDDVRILPARPMRAALRATFENSTDAEICDLRLNDPQFDMFVAMLDGQPVGRCAFYQVGDIARIMDLHLLPTNAPGDIERQLLRHVLTMARRVEMRNICTLVRADHAEALHLFTDAGFQRDGEIVEFHRPGREGADSLS